MKSIADLQGVTMIPPQQKHTGTIIVIHVCNPPSVRIRI